MGMITGAVNIFDFNPRSREGSDTPKETWLLQGYSISIHAPAKGATSITGKMTVTSQYFNPRSREGSDLSTL